MWSYPAITVTTFAIRTSSLLTSFRGLGCSIASPWDFVVDERTSFCCRHLLSHLRRFFWLSRKSTPVGRLHAISCGITVTFRVEPCCRLYPNHYSRAFASSNFSLLPLHKPVLRLTCHLSRDGEVVTFPCSAYKTIMDNVGGACTPVALQSRAGTL